MALHCGRHRTGQSRGAGHDPQWAQKWRGGIPASSHRRSGSSMGAIEAMKRRQWHDLIEGVTRRKSHASARYLRTHPCVVIRSHARRCPLAGSLRPDRRSLRGIGQRAGGWRRAFRARRYLLRQLLLPRSTRPRPGTTLLRPLLPPRRAHTAPAAPGRQPPGPHRRTLHRAGVEDLHDLQLGVAPGRLPEGPERAPGRPGRLQHRLDPCRPHRTGRLGVRPDRDDRASSASYPPVRAGAPGAGRRRSPGGLPQRVAGHHPGRRHPPGPARAHRRGERPCTRPFAARRRVGRPGRFSGCLAADGQRPSGAPVGGRAAEAGAARLPSAVR